MLPFTVFADDLTGALDVGAQFVARGLRVYLFCDPQESVPQDAEVLIYNMECRHLSAADAGERTTRFVDRAKQLGITRFFLKTDSGMRGNIGASMDAMMRALEKSVCFLPSHPREGRTTVDGVHYIHGIPVSRSSFGADRYNPVQYDRIADILHQQTSFPVVAATFAEKETMAISLFEAGSEAQLHACAAAALCHWDEAILAGCAGLAEILAEKLGASCEKSTVPEKMEGPVLLLSGSISPVTFEQLQEINGACTCFQIDFFNPAQRFASVKKAIDLLRKGNSVCFASAFCQEEAVRTQELAVENSFSDQMLARHIPSIIGEIAKNITEKIWPGTIIVIGGDTLTSLLDALNAKSVRIISPLENGAVQVNVSCPDHQVSMITKSGSYGNRFTLKHITVAAQSNGLRRTEL